MKAMKHIAMSMLALALGYMTQACTEDVDMSDRYTFQIENIASYLESHQDYSEYYRLLSEVKISSRSSSTVQQLMSARGNFTVFAPTNQAIQDYLDELNTKGILTEPTWNGFKTEEAKDSIRKVIVYNSILDGGDVSSNVYQTSGFPKDGEEFAIPNMNDRKLTIAEGKNSTLYINGKKDETTKEILSGCLIDVNNCDILASNGYIHQVHSVVAPSNETVADVFKSFIDGNTGDFIVMAKLILACNLQETLNKVKDEVYENAILNEEIQDLVKHTSYGKLGYVPEHRKYGFTVFAETDDFWRTALNKEPQDITPEDVNNWVVSQAFYPTAKDDGKYDSEDNVLNQFVTYHILPMRIPVDKLVIHHNEKGYKYGTSTSTTVATWELYTTLGKRRLMKIYEGGKGTEGIYLNRFPVLDNGRDGEYTELSCDPDKQGALINTSASQAVVNGYIYPIDKVLAYTAETRNNFQKQRMRFDAAGMFPEFMNNDIRASHRAEDRYLCVGIPTNSVYKYLDDVDIEDESLFYYLSGYNLSWHNYQGDELNVIGTYEMTMRLPPVPQKDTYEIRYAVQTNSNNRGMCQVYFGENKNELHAEGIPLDLRMGGLKRRTDAGTFTSIVGWETDNKDDEDYNAEVDKKMRNNGFMKGPNHYCPWGSSTTSRADEDKIRRIIVRQEMDPDKVYYIKFKTVLDKKDKEFYMDYIEFCAKAVYDNPSNPEDIW